MCGRCGAPGSGYVSRCAYARAVRNVGVWLCDLWRVWARGAGRWDGVVRPAVCMGACDGTLGGGVRRAARMGARDATRWGTGMLVAGAVNVPRHDYAVMIAV